MINCVCVDADKKSREAVEHMIKKIKGVRLIGTYAQFETAYKACVKNKVHIVFVRLYVFPIPKDRKVFLNKISKKGIRIIILTSKMRIINEAATNDGADYVLLPASSRSLWKASKKALNIIDHGIDISKNKDEGMNTSERSLPA